jgi:atypical dual specificity phosphatase
MPFIKSRGCLYLIGDRVVSIVNDIIHQVPESARAMYTADSGGSAQYHLTILTSAEVKSGALNLDQIINRLSSQPSADSVYSYGLGCLKQEQVWFAVCSYPAGNRLRLELGLPLKDFHITLGYERADCHTHPKNLHTLITRLKYIPYSAESDPNREILADPYHARTLLSDAFDECLTLNDLYIMAKYHATDQGICEWLSSKLSGDLFGLLLELNSLKKSGRESEIGRLVAGRLVDTTWTWSPDSEYVISGQVAKVLAIANRYTEANRVIIQDTFSRVVEHEVRFLISPRNYSEVLPGIYGSAIPSKPAYFRFLHLAGITDIITLMETPLHVPSEFAGLFTQHYFAIDDLHPPTSEQMQDITSVLSSLGKERRALVHCFGGVGRTATVLAAYIMYSKKCTRLDAMAYFEKRKTILTASQEDWLKVWYREIQKPQPVIKLPQYIIMVGYPASGKSTLSTALESSFEQGKVVRVNQDEVRQKGRCAELVSQGIKSGACVILDRCNLTVAERAEWLDTAFRPSNTWCIYFATDIADCMYRITRRKNHPTVKEGTGLNILKSLDGKLEEPGLAEGFSRIIKIHDMDELTQLIEQWHLLPPDLSDTMDQEADDFIIKFPRTRHILNVGAAARDDLIMPHTEAAGFLNCEIWVQEKCDGANIGISITADGTFRVQNRSHYVNSKDQAQFEKLDVWLQMHSAELWEILEPGRHILYGEWLYAKHSIHYTRLPGYFIAFDLYDKQTQTFMAQPRLEALLKEKAPAIPLVPCIFHGTLTKLDDFRRFLCKESQFYDGLVEGIYVRVCDANVLVRRGKIVRTDFLCGNKHWSKNQIERNQILQVI